MPNISRSAHAAAALAALLPCAALAAPMPPTGTSPQYAWHTITPLGAPGDHTTAARIIAFDALGRGYGYSLTGIDAAPVAAVRWENGTLTTLDTPAGTTDSHAAAASEDAVIGWARSARGSTGLMWSCGQTHQLGGILPLGVSSRGAVAGVIQNPHHPGRYAPAVWQNGAITPLPMHNPEAHGWVAGISARGDVAGSWFLHGGPSQAVRWRGGAPEVLALPEGALGSEASDMNAASVIVGSADLGAGRTAALLWTTDGAVADLGVLDPATPRAWAQSVNAHGHVVGVADTTSGRTAFLWDGESMRDLRDLIAAAGQPLGAGAELNVSHLVIADTGHIAGVRYLADGTAEPFVLVPIPAPGTLALAAVAAAPLARRRR